MIQLRHFIYKLIVLTQVTIRSCNKTMDVVILTGSDARFIRPFLSSGLSIKGIIKCTFNSKIDNPGNIIVRILKHIRRLISGTGDFENLEKKIIRRGIFYKKISCSDYESLEENLCRLKPDVIAAFNLGIIPSHLLTVPKHGILNLHPSLLPRYRGGDPIQWMANRFDLQGGVTIHFMSEKLDHGDIVVQEPFKVTPGSSGHQVAQRVIYDRGVNLMINSILAIQNNTITRTPQPTTSPTPYAKRLSHRDLWEFIDWHNWSLDHTWHMLCCTPFWVHYLPVGKSWRRLCEWEIAGRKPVSHNFDSGEIRRTLSGFLIAHKDGIIQVRPKLCIAKIAKALFKAKGL